MKFTLFAATALIAVSAIHHAQAAPPPAKTYESCSQLATQRGFMPNEKYGSRNKFIARCMKGRAQ